MLDSPGDHATPLSSVQLRIRLAVRLLRPLLPHALTIERLTLSDATCATAGAMAALRDCTIVASCGEGGAAATSPGRLDGNQLLMSPPLRLVVDESHLAGSVVIMAAGTSMVQAARVQDVASAARRRADVAPAGSPPFEAAALQVQLTSAGDGATPVGGPGDRDGSSAVPSPQLFSAVTARWYPAALIRVSIPMARNLPPASSSAGCLHSTFSVSTDVASRGGFGSAPSSGSSSALSPPHTGGAAPTWGWHAVLPLIDACDLKVSPLSPHGCVLQQW